ncbi:MAG: GNAT family N-acetyltransferase [Anaerolineae bacterium]|nr:GNAT family N-acetyltransferase [Anaerolineae bacterium]
MATQTTTRVIIRKATEADLAAMTELITPFVEQGLLLERTFEELSEWLGTSFIAEVDGKIIGCAALEIYSRKLAEIRSLAVSKDAQGLGVGKALVNACVELAHHHHILEVMAITASEEFFRSCGFDFNTPNLKKAMFFQTGD